MSASRTTPRRYRARSASVLTQKFVVAPRITLRPPRKARRRRRIMEIHRGGATPRAGCSVVRMPTNFWVRTLDDRLVKLTHRQPQRRALPVAESCRGSSSRSCRSTTASQATVMRGREDVQAILDGRDRRFLALVGPCSIHDSWRRARVRRAAGPAPGRARRPARDHHARVLREAARPWWDGRG